MLFRLNTFPETLSSFESSKGFNFDLLEMFFSFEKEKNCHGNRSKCKIVWASTAPKIRENFLVLSLLFGGGNEDMRAGARMEGIFRAFSRGELDKFQPSICL